MSKSKKWKSTLVVTACLVLAVSLSARADSTMHSANEDAGNQVWGGVGLTFDVVAPAGIKVLDLGIYDSGSDGIADDVTLSTVLFDSTPVVVGQKSFTAGDPGTFDAASNYWFKPLTIPPILLPGRYTIVGYGWTSGNSEHNSNVGGVGPAFDNGGGAISFYQSVWTSNNNDLAPTFPTSTGSPDYFDGPNMRFEVVAVPVPGAILLGLLGLSAAGLKLRKFA